MIVNHQLHDGIAPSYFLEGMLYNVPNVIFGSSYVATVSGALHWLKTADRGQLLCANEQYYLLRDGAPECWKPGEFEAYFAAQTKFWDNWR